MCICEWMSFCGWMSDCICGWMCDFICEWMCVYVNVSAFVDGRASVLFVDRYASVNVEGCVSVLWVDV